MPSSAEKLKVFIDVSEYSVPHVAEACGITRVSVYNYLAGKKIPDDFVRSLVKKFSLNPLWWHFGKLEDADKQKDYHQENDEKVRALELRVAELNAMLKQVGDIRSIVREELSKYEGGNT